MINQKIFGILIRMVFQNLSKQIISSWLRFTEFPDSGHLSDMIIPKAIRDAYPHTCSGDTFITTDTLENWVVLD